MNELDLFRITEKHGVDVVSAFDIYQLLGLNIAHYSKWYRLNITENDMFTKNIDWSYASSLGVMYINNQLVRSDRQDIAITLDTAKHILLMSKTEVGQRYRKYLIQFERNKANAPALTPSELLVQMAQQLVDRERKMRDSKNQFIGF